MNGNFHCQVRFISPETYKVPTAVQGKCSTLLIFHKENDRGNTLYQVHIQHMNIYRGVWTQSKLLSQGYICTDSQSVQFPQENMVFGKKKKMCLGVKLCVTSSITISFRPSNQAIASHSSQIGARRFWSPDFSKYKCNINHMFISKTVFDDVSSNIIIQSSC